jgi:osmoprotectant transport system permease protein
VRTLALLGALLTTTAAPAVEITVGSKAFPESLILGEMLAQLAREAGAEAHHGRTRGLGGTRVLWEALVKGDIDAYPEYTGTLREEIFAGRGLRDEEALRQALAEKGLRMGRSLGFNDTYALGMREETAARLAIKTISDLKNHPELTLGFSNEFLKRGDGWPSLQARYGLPQRNVKGLEHALAYDALRSGAIDVMELYSTDIRVQHIRVLRDDLGHFPPYHAVVVYRAELEQTAPQVVAAWRRLEGTISEEEMAAMNARVKLLQESDSRVAADFLRSRLRAEVTLNEESLWARLGRTTWEHLLLVSVSLAAAVVVAVPLGIVAARRPQLGHGLLAAAGVVQTIPSLALLVFLIPILHLGARPAIAALFLYSVLPILRNTAAGLRGVAPELREAAEALGLSSLGRLRIVELPLASRAILAGIKTSAVINVGTATLGGFVGAGGYGQPIFQGLTLQNNALVLEGAVPAALLALAVQGLFELVERGLVPRGLRLTG